MSFDNNFYKLQQINRRNIESKATRYDVTLQRPTW